MARHIKLASHEPDIGIMRSVRRTVALLAASGVAGLSFWTLLVAWASSAGLYENSNRHGGRADLWLTLFSILLALAAIAFVSRQRIREGVGLTMVALLAQVAVALSGGYAGYM
jgi:hypothetical protein